MKSPKPKPAEEPAEIIPTRPPPPPPVHEPAPDKKDDGGEPPSTQPTSRPPSQRGRRIARKPTPSGGSIHIIIDQQRDQQRGESRTLAGIASSAISSCVVIC
jgi:hypothetical protein